MSLKVLLQLILICANLHIRDQLTHGQVYVTVWCVEMRLAERRNPPEVLSLSHLSCPWINRSRAPSEQIFLGYKLIGSKCFHIGQLDTNMIHYYISKNYVIYYFYDIFKVILTKGTLKNKWYIHRKTIWSQNPLHFVLKRKKGIAYFKRGHPDAQGLVQIVVYKGSHAIC